MAQPAEPTYDPEGELQRLEEVRRESEESGLNERSREDVRGREEWFRFQRSYPYDRIPAGSRVAAIRQMREMEQRLEQARANSKGGVGLLSVNRWENIGPDNQAGRVRAIGVDVANPGTLYIGSAAGGVWKTTNAGTNWFTTFDTLSSLAMGALAIDPSNPNIVYAGTGENTNNIDAYLGDGVFKSTDGGTTWKNIGLETVGAISKLYVHRNDGRIIYAATAKANGGFYVTTNGGNDWTKIVSGTLFDMVVDPSNNDIVYIALNNSVRRSTNRGANFTEINTGINRSNILRISIGISPTTPNRLYALVARDSSNENHIGEVYRSDNSGGNWTLLKKLPSSFFNQQGWYDNCLAVHPTEEDIALVGGIDVFKTTDGGANWTNTTKGYSGGTTHVDQHILTFDPVNPNTVYLGNDGGVYRSTNAGTSWSEISLALPNTQYYAMEVDQTRPFRVYGGTQDNGTHGTYGTTGFLKNWSKVLDGDGFYVVVDLSDPNIIYAENYNGTPLYRINANNLSSKTRIDASISPTAKSGDIGYWSTPIAMSPADKKTLYSGRTGLYRTSDRGSSWEKLTPGNSTGSGGKISAIGLSPHNAGKICLGFVAEGVRFSIDNGATWKKSTGLPTRFVTDVRYDPVVDGRVYVTLSGQGTHLFRSDNNGESFTNISANLPNSPANSIEIDSANNNVLFVATDVGVFVTLDAGGYWMPFNDGLALSPIISLKIHRSSRTLVAATHGRSMFRVNIDGIEPQPALIAPLGGESFTTPGTLLVRWAGFVGPVRVYLSYDGGATYDLVADNVVGDSTSIPLPLVRTSSARVRIVAVNGGAAVESGEFNLLATANGQDYSRGFIAEAIEIRYGYLWATVRGNDSLYKLKLPLLNNLQGLIRTGMTGRVRDLTHDLVRDRFYVLTGGDDFNGARLYVMDTNGAGVGEIPLPTTTVAGVAYVPGKGIAVVTPGESATIYLIDTIGTVLEQIGPLQDAPGGERRGLVWDGLGYVQGATLTTPASIFPTQLQHLTPTNPLRIREAAAVIPNTSLALRFYGLAFDDSNSIINKRSYWATDTAGRIYKFTRENFFTSDVARTGLIDYRSVEVGITAITPNPMSGESTLHYMMRSRRSVSIDLFDMTGLRIASLFEGTVGPGEQTLTLRSDGLASGIYYVAIGAGPGQRDVRSVVVVK